MQYLIKRAGRFYFNRRIPKAYKEFDSRPYVRVALNTTNKIEAFKGALAQNEALEAYWLNLSLNANSHDYYKTIAERAKLLGFGYHHVSEIAQLPLADVMSRVRHSDNNKNHIKHVEAVLGGVEAPAIRLSDCFDRYWHYSKNKTLNKSLDQIRKWKNPREKAMRNLIKCIGNKPINEITRDDTLQFRDWWIKRMDKESLLSSSANKDLIYTKTIIETVSDNLKLNVDTSYLFKKLVLTIDDAKKRLPFETSHIVSVLLKPENLKDLDFQARCVLMAIAETGAGIAEQVGLLPEDIVLDAEIPHIAIAPRNKRALKTKYRKRTIPLVGYALEAFKQCPEGFPKYRDCPDRLSDVLSKYLRENNLMPSDQHTVYSLRHSFQDRLLAVNAPDRVQADLMGHKFNRQAYGNGASLEQKLEWLEKIQLKRNY